MRYIVILLLLLASCNNTEKPEDDPTERYLQELQQADFDMAKFSREHGMRKAFMEFMDDDGVVLRDNNMPIVGANAIEYITSMNDSTIVLTWEPKGGDVSKSGDLGYTYGVYELKDSVNTQKGTYVTVWKRQANGKWKFVLDSENQGIGE